jgi:bifunctional UDP-N-acetylglucosamine pyrophosphorylase / glucosamine-1-phosphate N-acetyltransferase
MKNQIIILAGGKGTRMKSDIPKVLTKIKGISIIKRQLKNLADVCSDPIIIIGHNGNDVIKETNNKYRYIWQKEQLGTGHALMCAKEKIEKEEMKNIIVIPGDHPLISKETINNLIKSHNNSKSVISLAIVNADNFIGSNSIFYNCGRIVRNKNSEVCGIVELKEATDQQKLIKELNVSYYCFDTNWLWGNIYNIKKDNNAEEYYLTDIVDIAIKQNLKINTVVIKNSSEGMGINSREQLKLIEEKLDLN